jgi:hypothetical protein
MEQQRVLAAPAQAGLRANSTSMTGAESEKAR